MRKAVAMIELIFSIVIMGIILMSAPMLVSTATESGYVAIQQEAINEAATQANIILGHNWDEENTDESIRAVIVTTANGDAQLAEVNGTSGSITLDVGRRAGTPATSYRRFIRNDGTRANASAIGSDGAEASDADFDDVDDFDGSTVNLQLIEAAGQDYVEKGTDIDIVREVAYTADAAGGNYITDSAITFTPDFGSTATAAADSTNIKRIQVTLTSTSGVDELEKTITLHAFSCNIGSYELEEK
jgi:hypothetical protein